MLATLSTCAQLEREIITFRLQSGRKQNVLVIDDVTTSGSTLNEILRSLRIVNDDNNITILSLIGRKDLMAESK